MDWSERFSHPCQLLECYQQGFRVIAIVWYPIFPVKMSFNFRSAGTWSMWISCAIAPISVQLSHHRLESPVLILQSSLSSTRSLTLIILLHECECEGLLGITTWLRFLQYVLLINLEHSDLQVLNRSHLFIDKLLLTSCISLRHKTPSLIGKHSLLMEFQW